MSLSYPEAAVIGLLQGVTELFPVSSVGHSVLLPALIGGSWAKDLDVSSPESPYLSFVVGLHVATAFALVVYFRRDWVRIIGGLFTSLRDRRIETTYQKMAWMLIVGTIPVGIVGLAFEHVLRTKFAKPLPASIFLLINGLLLLLGERLRRRSVEAEKRQGGKAASDVEHDRRIVANGWTGALVVGTSQIGALFAGISRSGIAMTSGLLRGLSQDDAARFAFLLATPVILAAGVLKAGDLTATFPPDGKHIYGQVAVGSILAGVAAFASVHFLSRYFEKRTLTPFAVYCIVAGAACAIRFA